MSLKEKTSTEDLLVAHPEPVRRASDRKENCESMDSTAPTLVEPSMGGCSPSSPFYSHRQTRQSHDAQEADSKLKVFPGIYETDLEAATTNKSSVNVGMTPMTTRTNQDCPVWPGRSALQRQKKQAKKQRGCNPMRNFSKRQKITIKVLIALVIVGAAVGIGLGISKAVGGGIWKDRSPIEHN